MNNQVVLNIRKELEKKANKKIRERSQYFFKETVKFHGLKSLQASEITNKYFPQIKILNKNEIFAISEELFKSGYFEETIIACNFIFKINKSFEEKDLLVFEKFIKTYVNNWATCDTFCNHTMGTFILKYPKYLNILKTWAKSKNRWVKRAAAVTLILPARKGYFLKQIFEIADILLLDSDDMVQKGYGWMLKEASKAYQSHVFDYVIEHKQNMPRTALRYAIEKMPKDLKIIAMKKE